jgi:SAM-dependent methyltransferase
MSLLADPTPALREPPAGQAWQLQMFRRSIKKRLKLKALLKHLGNLNGQKCLLLTCGDNTGALNWHFRQHGGGWTWGDVAGENVQEMADFLREPVLPVAEAAFPFEDDEFDCAVVIDVLEHLQADQPLLRELGRVLKPGGRAVVTVPNGDSSLLANRFKRRIGMTPDVYGHTRAGYTVKELRESVARAGLNPVGEGGYSRFLTELVELVINFGYVFALSRKRGRPGRIAPTTKADFKHHGAAYRLYALAFPVLAAIAWLDRLLPASGNYAVIVSAVKSAPRVARS